jgi:hypothetical protein
MAIDYKPTVPSGLLKPHDENQFGTFNHDFKNFSLKTGLVIKLYDLKDDDNEWGLSPEYDVAVIEQDEGRGSTLTIYHHCLDADNFGNIADFHEVKRRTTSKPKDFLSDKTKALLTDETDGSIVLLMCADGVSGKGIIIGGLNHPSRKLTLTKDKEIHLEGEFNGIRYFIDKDGAFKITQKTATDQKDGKPLSEEAAGSFLSIEKDGSIELGDDKLDPELAKGNKKPDPDAKEEEAEEEEEEDSEAVKYEKLRIDRTKKMVDLEAREDINIKTDKNMKVTVKENIETKVMKDMITEAEGNAMLKLKGMYDAEIKGNAKIKVPSVEIDIKDRLLLNSQQIFIDSPTVLIDSKRITLGRFGRPSLIQSTQFLGIGNLGQPVMSVAIGPFSTTVFIE